MSRPSLFVGSSTEGRDMAHAIRQQVKDVAEVTLWTDGPFGLSKGTLESLANALAKFDFAVLAITGDDLTTSRGTETPSPRDNVIFETGLFMGRIGRERTFLVYDGLLGRSCPPGMGEVRAVELSGGGV